jgi:uncharacterized protein YoxC
MSRKASTATARASKSEPALQPADRITELERQVGAIQKDAVSTLLKAHEALRDLTVKVDRLQTAVDGVNEALAALLDPKRSSK